MRQVPYGKEFYTLIGSGHLAKHLKYWLSFKDLSFNTWDRHSQQTLNTIKLEDSLKKSNIILLAVSDTALDNFIQKYHNSHLIIHFSGAFYSKLAIGAHPLMTFNKSNIYTCLLYTSPSPRDQRGSRMPSSA